mgnify:CR=1 FL=1
MQNFIKPEQFPYKSPTGWEYDSGNYHAALQKAMDIIGYDALRQEQAEKRARGELMGIGISSFTEVVGGELKEGDTIITGASGGEAAAARTSSSPFNQGGAKGGAKGMGGGGRRGGF